ncbi:helix-turn-helix transcriptional regulator [Plantactinospora sp. S1510]|uniref:Helix-turn-helix transcriptional regulator n=1 Tax=Plantactinospora alkalitolerans TaxID=2789879 RepID=A0ABS0GNU8_9ACTN|nr:TetR/AcrR family transcriptional regulator [Plantactinospora alkalitolerans]MBF9127864.1 helix-turn-helix transcriptional regulator [Plantactinospora alkalitolerans]
MSPNSKRGPRSDALRNATVLLDAARQLVEEVGNEITLDEVARRAGVGNATLYRHFPTREDLLAAVYADEVANLCRHGAQLLGAPSPLDALFSWLDEFVVHVATKRPLALAATEGPGGRRGHRFETWHSSITATATDLVHRAQPALRPGLTAADVLALASGAALTTDTAQARRLVGFLRTGLAAPTGSAERDDQGFGS